MLEKELEKKKLYTEYHYQFRINITKNYFMKMSSNQMILVKYWYWWSIEYKYTVCIIDYQLSSFKVWIK